MNAVVETVPRDVMTGFIERAARDPEFDVGKFRELLVMQREATQESERREFNQAMAAAARGLDPGDLHGEP